MARRQYYGAATPTTITSSITTSSSSVAIAAYTGWPTGSFSLVIDPGLSSEEKILATSQTTGTITFTTRGYDGTTASAHNAGAVIYPVPTAIDFDEANAHTVATTGVHGVTGAVVGDVDIQTLTNKKLSDSTTSFIDSTDATKVLKIDVTGTTGITGTLTSAFTTAKTLTLPDATDTLVGKATTDYLTNKTLTAPKELWTIAASAATGTIQFDCLTQGVLYYTTASSANWTLNFRGSSGTTLNSLMSTGDAITVNFLATNTTAYYQSTAVTVDTNATVSVKWSGGTAAASGNASAVDIYSYTILKTGTSAFTVLCAGPIKYA